MSLKKLIPVMLICLPFQLISAQDLDVKEVETGDGVFILQLDYIVFISSILITYLSLGINVSW